MIPKALGAPTRVQSNVNTATSTSVSTAFSSPNTAGNSGFAFFDNLNGTPELPTGISDTQQNKWVLIGSLLDAPDFVGMAVYWVQSLKAGANTVTVTVSGSSGLELYVFETTPANVDVLMNPSTGTTFNTTGGGATTVATVGPQNITQANELVLAFATSGGSGGPSSAGPGFAFDTHSPSNSDSTALEYGTFATTSVTATVNMTQSTSWVIVMLALSANDIAYDRQRDQLFSFTQNGALQVPPDVNTLDANCFGAGGGGAGSDATGGGSGGGGSIQSRQPLTVTPGTIVSVSIGQPAAAPALGTNGGPGGDTTVQAGATVLGTWSGASGGASGVVGASGGRSFKATGGGNAYVSTGFSGAVYTDVAAGGYAASRSNSAGLRNCVGGFDGGAAGATTSNGGGGGGGAGPEGAGGAGGADGSGVAGTVGSSAQANTGAGGGGGGSGTPAVGGSQGGSGKAYLSYVSKFAPVWLPMMTLTTNPVLWLRADQGITIATGVSQWADLSGFGNHFVQATGGNQPTLLSNGGPGGQPAVSFDGATSVMTAPLLTTNTQNWTMFAVLQIIGQAQANAYLFANGYTTGWGLDIGVTNMRGIVEVGVGSGLFGSCTTSFEEWCAYDTAGTQSARVNGVPITPASNLTLSAGNTGSTLGATNGGSPSAFAQFNLCELIVYAGAAPLTLADIQQVEQYMANFWGGGVGLL
jgi:hypothetical protein